MTVHEVSDLTVMALLAVLLWRVLRLSSQKQQAETERDQLKAELNTLGGSDGRQAGKT